MQRVYLDHAATTAQRREVSAAMKPYECTAYGNSSSVHGPGRAARATLEEARERLAGILRAERRQVVFTAGGTSANNLAVLGRWRAVNRTGPSRLLTCSAVEHKAVLATMMTAAQEGAEWLRFPVDSRGVVDLESVREAVARRPALVSVMWANNEVGTVQPVKEIVSMCREEGVVFHSDGVQALGRIPVDVESIPCDLLSLSSHKIGGPHGVGALYIRDGVDIDPILHGGGQERGLWPGTPNVGGALGFAVAAELAEAEREREFDRQQAMRNRLESALRERIPGLVVHGSGARRLPHILSVTVPAVERESLLISLDADGIAVSSGAACQSGQTEPSHVPTAMGASADYPAAVIRLSFGSQTTRDQVEYVAERLPVLVARLRTD